MKKYNVGIVGYGWVATAHIPAINATPLGQVTAVCSSRKLDAAALSAPARRPASSVYNDLDEMLANPDIHVVSLCGFPTQRLDQVVRAARAGQAPHPGKAALPFAQGTARDAQGREAGEGQDLRLLRVPLRQPVPGHQGRPRPGPAGHVHYGEVDYYHGIGPWYAQFRWCRTQGRGRQLPARSRLPRAWTRCCCAWAARSSKS